MPSGSMCDACNNYLSRLDSALANHPDLSVCIQALSLPGKARKPRMELGWLRRVGDHSSRSVTILSRGIKRLEIDGNKISVDLHPPRGWNRNKFHRALHYVAFNLLSLAVASDELLGAPFDPVRRYVRAPKSREAWPYCHALLAPKLVGGIELSILDSPVPQVAIRLFNHVFAVDLFHSGTLLQQLIKRSPPGLTWEEVPA